MYSFDAPIVRDFETPMRLRLIHWNAEEARERAERLEAAGHRVAWKLPAGGPSGSPLSALRRDPPDAFVIDLSRIPSQGRDLGLALRSAKATRGVPLVFVGGDPAKVAKVRELLPDAVYASWRGIRGALRRAVAHPPAAPVVPGSVMAGYSGTPLPKKLGIKPGSTVALAGAPSGVEATLGELPEGAALRKSARADNDLLLWFVRSRRDLERRVAAMGERAGRDGLWILWPKKASGVKSDVSEKLVRAAGLGAGLVDYKICAFDATWSGLRFARRKR